MVETTDNYSECPDRYSLLVAARINYGQINENQAREQSIHLDRSLEMESLLRLPSSVSVAASHHTKKVGILWVNVNK